MLKTLSVFLFFSCLIIFIGYSLYGISTTKPVPFSSENCEWPFCQVDHLNQEGYINGIYQNQLDKKQFIEVSWNPGNITYKTPYLYPHSFNAQINLDKISFKLKGQEIDKPSFLKYSLGAKVKVKGLVERHLGGIDQGGRRYYDITDIDIIELPQEIIASCKDCRTFSNSYMSFVYGSDWKVTELPASGGTQVEIRKNNFRSDEDPNLCFDINDRSCSCSDINKPCLYSLGFLITPFPEEITKFDQIIFSNFNDFKYKWGNIYDGDQFEITYSPNLYVRGWLRTTYIQHPFTIEKDFMPYIIFNSLKIKA